MRFARGMFRVMRFARGVFWVMRLHWLYL
jgi:hypothetical protein